MYAWFSPSQVTIFRELQIVMVSPERPGTLCSWKRYLILQPTHVDMKKNLQNSVINVHRKYTNKFAFKSFKENPVEPWKIQIRINQIFPTRWRFSGLGIVWRDKFIAPDNFLSLSLTDWPAPDTAILSPTTKRWEAQATPWSTTFATYTPFEVLKYHHSILPQIIKPVSSESRLKAEMSISGETISLVFSRLLIICLTPNHFFQGVPTVKKAGLRRLTDW